MRPYLDAFLVSFFLGCFLLFLLKRFSRIQSIFRHNDEASFVGGVGLLLSFVLGSATLFFYKNVYVSRELTHILIFAFLFFITCLFDDFKEFSLSKKIIIQVILIGLFLVKGKPIQIYFVPLWGNYIISFLWIAGITNVFNLLDIGDGFCAGVSLIVGLAFFITLFIGGNIITAGLFAALCGALSAFLIFNFPPAKIMLGNSGSHFLGFLFAVLSMHGDYATLDNPFSVLVPLTILAFPMIDTLYLIVARLRKGIFPLKKSNDHIFLSLLSSGKGIKHVLLEIYLITLLWGTSGVFLVFGLNAMFFVSATLAILFSVRLIVMVQRVQAT